MAGIATICPVCHLKPVKNCHYGAFVCKNCAQMFKRNCFREDLVCREDERYCRVGSTHPCPKCRILRCHKEGMNTGLISIPESQAKKAGRKEFKTIREMVIVVEMAKQRIKDHCTMTGEPRALAFHGSGTIFLNQQDHFPATFVNIRMLNDHRPTILSHSRSPLEEQFFYYYIVLVHTWIILKFPDCFEAYQANTDLLFLNPATFIVLSSSRDRNLHFTHAQLEQIKSGLRKCSAIAIDNKDTWPRDFESATIYLLALVKIGMSHGDKEKFYQIQETIIKEFNLYSDNNTEILDILRYIEEVDKTVRDFQAINFNQSACVLKPACRRPGVKPEVNTAFLCDGYTAELPSQCSAFRQVS